MKRAVLLKKADQTDLDTLKKQPTFIGQEITVTEKGKSATYKVEETKGKKFAISKEGNITY